LFLILKFLKPCVWQLASDGKHLIGHLVLKSTPLNNNNNRNSMMNHSTSTSSIDSNDFNSSLSLGFKVLGGQLNPLTNDISAYVVKVKKDSVCDTVGHLQVGDEILKWNGKSFRGLSFEKVDNLIKKSKKDGQVELLVQREMK
jgi:C-terminal processing protease CtpA/Prc